MKKFSFLFTLLLFTLYAHAHEKVVILGKGSAGVTAAIYAGQALLSPLVIDGQPCDGQLVVIHQIENYPGFPEGIAGDELLDRMTYQAQKFGARFMDGFATAVNFTQSPFTITLNTGETITTDSVIIATGASPRWLGVKGEEELKGKGVSSSATCDAELFTNKHVAVVGGGDAALEQALQLSEHASKVSLLVRDKKLNASPYLIERVLNDSKINVIYNTKVDEVLGTDWVTGVVLSDLTTQQTTTLSCDGLFVSIGRKPNTDIFKNQIEMDKAGIIRTQHGSMATSVPGVFAAGDITEYAYKKVITAAASGCMAAIDATRYLKK